MQIDFSSPITDISDSPIIERDGESTQTVTLGAVCVRALLGGDQSKLKAEDKVTRFRLAERIHRASVALDVKAEDIAALKRLVGETYGALVVGRAWALLDPEPAAEGSTIAPPSGKIRDSRRNGRVVEVEG